MKLPGIPAMHTIITDTCRTNRTDEGAFDEAVSRIKREYEKCVHGWPVGKGVQFHLVLTVERPEAKP